jgi:hypothetical protein
MYISGGDEASYIELTQIGRGSIYLPADIENLERLFAAIRYRLAGPLGKLAMDAEKE